MSVYVRIVIFDKKKYQISVESRRERKRGKKQEKWSLPKHEYTYNIIPIHYIQQTAAVSFREGGARTHYTQYICYASPVDVRHIGPVAEEVVVDWLPQWDITCRPNETHQDHHIISYTYVHHYYIYYRLRAYTDTSRGNPVTYCYIPAAVSASPLYRVRTRTHTYI